MAEKEGEGTGPRPQTQVWKGSRAQLPRREGEPEAAPAGRPAGAQDPAPGGHPLSTHPPEQGRHSAAPPSALCDLAAALSVSPAHTFSRGRVHADEALHPAIADEICIDSKIKSNEKKIGSQPDPTVPDCCPEEARRHFFMVSRIQLMTSSYPIPHD